MVCAKTFVIGIGHKIFGLVKVRPRRGGGDGQSVNLKHHSVISSLRVHRQRRYASQIVFFIIITVQNDVDYP